MSNQNLPAVIQTAITNQDIDVSKVNLVLPTETFGQVIGKYDKVTIEIVRVDPDPANKEVYELEGKLQLGKVPLQKMSTGLGILWDPKNTGSVESTEWKSRAKATGALRKPNGEWIITTEEKTVDVSVDVKAMQLKYEEDAEKGNFSGKVTKWGTTRTGKKYPEEFEPWESEQQKATAIDRAVRKAVLQRLKFKDELALTGAKDRVIRFFLALKAGYTAAELSKPIAFPRISLDASKMLEDPSMRTVAIAQMTGAVRSIFGQGEQEPQHLAITDGEATAADHEQSIEVEGAVENGDGGDFDFPPATAPRDKLETEEDRRKRELREELTAVLEDAGKRDALSASVNNGRSGYDLVQSVVLDDNATEKELRDMKKRVDDFFAQRRGGTA